MDQILINQNFDDFDSFATTAQEWDVDFLQMEKGSFAADLLQYVSKDFQFARACFNRSLEQKGSPPKKVWTFALKVLPDLFMYFKNKKIIQNDLMIYHPGSEIDATSLSRFDVFTFSVSEGFLEALAEKNRILNFRKYFKDVHVLTCEQYAIDRLRDLLLRLFHELMHNTGRKPKARLRKNWLFNAIPETILRAACHFQEPKYNPVLVRDIAFQKATEYVHTFGKEKLTIKDLAFQTRVSDRTLEHVFGDRLGVTPKQYIRAVRLNRVRQGLKKSIYSKITITDIAYECGFGHMGQFAKDYKQMFGELPSSTLKKK